MEIKSSLIEAHIIGLNEDKIEYLLLKRASDQLYPNIWQMVTGKVRDNEKAYETAVREIYEETKLNIIRLYVVPNINSFYNDIDDSVNLVPVFVAVVDNHKTVILSDEHQDCKWVKKKEAKKLLAWSGQAASVDIIDDYFRKKKDNLNFIEIGL